MKYWYRALTVYLESKMRITLIPHIFSEDEDSHSIIEFLKPYKQ